MFTSKARGLYLVPLASLILASCSVHQATGPEKSTTSPQWLQHKQQVEKISRYETRGSFAYLSDSQNGSGSQNLYARFNWQQTAPDRYRLLLTNPLGSTVLNLNVQPNLVELIDGNGKHYQAQDADEMIARITGMPIPLNVMRQWILGLPGPAADYKIDDQYRLSSLTYSQSNKTWKVTYNDYDDTRQPALPTNIELTSADLRLKLKMDNWAVQ